MWTETYGCSEASVQILLFYLQGSVELGLKYSKPGNRGLRSLRSAQLAVGIFSIQIGQDVQTVDGQLLVTFSC